MRIREFMGADFDVVARLLGTEWHGQHGNRSYWQGADELCEHLSQTDKGLVAENDEGELVGIALLASPRAEDRDNTLRMHWLQQRTRLGAMAQALGIDARADAAFLTDDNEIMTRAAEKFGSDGVGELVLLFVREDARGQGVGATLLREGTTWLRDHGARRLRLVTDDGCDWEFYERKGMNLVLEMRASLDPLVGIYVYEGDI